MAFTYLMSGSVFDLKALNALNFNKMSVVELLVFKFVTK